MIRDGVEDPSVQHSEVREIDQAGAIPGALLSSLTASLRAILSSKSLATSRGVPSLGPRPSPSRGHPTLLRKVPGGHFALADVRGQGLAPRL